MMRAFLITALVSIAASASAREQAGELRRDLGVAASSREGGQAVAPVRPAPPAGQEKSQVFRAGVEMVSLNVTVTDSQNHYVTDLDQGDFSVFEDGAKQELSFFNKTIVPQSLCPRTWASSL